MVNETTETLTVSARDAAKALGISTRHLYAMTAPRGPIPCIKLGRRIVYRWEDLLRALDTLTVR
jgi:hypothetical protein